MVITDSPELICGLDIGTTSISAVVLNRQGRVEHSVTLNHEALVPDLPADHAEQDPRKLMSTALVALKRLAAEGRGQRIRAIAVTGQMHSTVLSNSDFQTLGNVITWQDRRAVTPSTDGRPTLLEQLKQRAPAGAVENSGCAPSAGYMGTTLFSLARLKQLPADFCHASFVADWLVSQLTSRPPVTDRSHAASSGLFDLKHDVWNSELLAAAEVNPSVLPKVLDSGVVVGAVSESIATDCDLPAGTPVCNAIGDNQASVLSCLPSSPETILINIGTGGQIVWRSHEFRRLPRLDTRFLPHDPLEKSSASDGGRQFMMVGAGLSGGDAIAWVNRTIRNWLSVFGVQMSDFDVWDRLAEQIAANPTNDGLVCEPFFRGTRQDPMRRGVFRGVTNDNFTPVQVAISVLNGIAESMWDVFRESGRAAEHPLRRIVMSGNAAKRNPLLVEAVQRRFEVPVEVAAHSEEAATGTAILAGARLGLFESIEAARVLVREAASSSGNATGPPNEQSS